MGTGKTGHMPHRILSQPDFFIQSAQENIKFMYLEYQIVTHFLYFFILCKTMKCKMYAIFEYCCILGYYFLLCIKYYSGMKSQRLYCDIEN